MGRVTPAGLSASEGHAIVIDRQLPSALSGPGGVAHGPSHASVLSSGDGRRCYWPSSPFSGRWLCRWPHAGLGSDTGGPPDIPTSHAGTRAFRVGSPSHDRPLHDQRRGLRQRRRRCRHRDQQRHPGRRRCGHRAALARSCYLPAGTYRITESINLNRSNVVLRGAGSVVTKIRLDRPTATERAIRMGYSGRSTGPR